jgi:large subunit ribosomal protein L13
MIINAENLILGRLSSYAAKKALLGEEIHIVNCEKAVITGSKENILSKYEKRIKMGTPFKGPFLSRSSDKIVKRTIRGMLSHRQFRGKEALKSIKCYNGIPDSFKDQKFETIKKANMEKLKNLRFIYVKDLAKLLGKEV